MTAKEIGKILSEAWVVSANEHIDFYNEKYPKFVRNHVTPADLGTNVEELSGLLPIESKFGTISFVEERGGEGDGAPTYFTIKVGDRYFEMCGRYSSWDESTWDTDLYEVFPEEVTITKFRRK